MDNGQYSPVNGGVFGLRHFAATMVARGKVMPLCFARNTEVQHGEVFISSESLSRLFMQKVRQSGSQFSDLKMEMNNSTVHLSGKVHKGVAVPFDIEGPVSTDGRVLLLQAKKIKVEGLSVKKFLDVLGKHLESLLGSESVEGVTAKGDTLIFEPLKIAHVRGAITRTQTDAKGLMITFGEPATRAAR